MSVKNNFAVLISKKIVEYFEQDKKPEIELVKIYLESFKNAVQSAGSELQKQYKLSDGETHSLINNHLKNTGIVTMLSSTNAMLAKGGGGILGFLDKLLVILEIIKKVIMHIIELFPKFLEKLLKKIIIPILELFENLIKIILELFSNKEAPKYLKAAERDLLETHPLWRKLQFETLDPSID